MLWDPFLYCINDSIQGNSETGNKVFVLPSKVAINTQIKLTERCYISNNEREYYKNIRLEESKLGDDKVKLAKRQYRGQGRYIDEILS